MNEMSPGNRLGIQSFYLPQGAPTRPRIARGEGVWLIDDAGKRYFDASSGPVASNLGHGNRRVIDAMKRQLDEAAFAFPLQFESEANLDLAARLKRLARVLKSGDIETNGKGTGPGAPFGGVKASGIGREGGIHGLMEFLEVKAVSGWPEA